MTIRAGVFWIVPKSLQPFLDSVPIIATLKQIKKSISCIHLTNLEQLLKNILSKNGWVMAFWSSTNFCVSSESGFSSHRYGSLISTPWYLSTTDSSLLTSGYFKVIISGIFFCNKKVQNYENENKNKNKIMKSSSPNIHICRHPPSTWPQQQW